MKTKNILIILSFFIFATYINAQVTEDWVNRYNGSGSGLDKAYSVAVDDSGNCYATGFATGSGTNYDIVTKSYNSSGSTRWTSIYNSSNGNEVGLVVKYYNGYIYVAGYDSTSSNFRDYITIKYNAFNGNEIWTAMYDGAGNGNDHVNDMAVDNSGNVYVTGISASNGNYDDIATIKYNSSGTQQWVATYDNDRSHLHDYGHAIYVDILGNVYVTGATTESSALDYVTIKYNSSGSQQWLKKYDNGDNHDIANSLSVDETGDNPGNVYVTGGSSGNDFDILTVAYSNSDGTELWSDRYTGSGNYSDNGIKVKVNNSGYVIVSGNTFTSSTNDHDYITIKYNSSGTEQWTTTYNGTGSHRDLLYDMTLDGDGNIYVTGLSRNSNSSEDAEDYATIKYNSSGVQQWVIRYNPSYNASDAARSIAINGSGVVFVTGWSENSTDWDYATIKYTQSSDNVIVNGFNTEMPKIFDLYQNYPNPFNPITRIKFGLPKASLVSLCIYDVLGREVASLVNNQTLEAGYHSFNFDASILASGVYYYKLTAGEFSDVKKMVIIK